MNRDDFSFITNLVQWATWIIGGLSVLVSVPASIKVIFPTFEVEFVSISSFISEIPEQFRAILFIFCCVFLFRFFYKEIFCMRLGHIFVAEEYETLTVNMFRGLLTLMYFVAVPFVISKLGLFFLPEYSTNGIPLGNTAWILLPLVVFLLYTVYAVFIGTVVHSRSETIGVIYLALLFFGYYVCFDLLNS